jgi:cytoskeleton protein RodZ
MTERVETAGALLRAAREKQGLHIAALAASIKVPPRKLEALEAGRYDELSGAIFTRALAQSVCRALRIDAAPVLALLPQAMATDLDNVTGSLNAPFRDRVSRDDGGLAVVAQRWLIGGSVVLLAAAAFTWFLPTLRTWWTAPLGGTQVSESTAPAPAAAVPASMPASAVLAAAPGASAPSAAPPDATAAAVPAPVASTAAGAAPTAAAPSASTAVEVTHLAPPLQPSSTPPPAGVLQLSTSDSSWIEVRDGQGRLLLSRIVQRGEAVGVDGLMPLRLTIGNAPATQVLLRGQPVDLAASTRDNVARIELR